MKKCERLIDYLDSNDYDNGSKTWLDIQEHAKKCPDCSIDLDLRGKIIDNLKDMDSVILPSGFHQEIMQSIEIGENVHEPGKLDDLFDRLLLPLQYGFAAVCLYLVLSLSSLPSINKNVKPAFHESGYSLAGKMAKLDSIKKPKPEQLAEVSPEEVKDFLTKLNKYKKEHPELNANYKRTFSDPEVRLVSYW